MATGVTSTLQRGASAYLIEPEKLVVRGVDTPESDVSSVQLSRLKQPLNEATVLSIMAVGVQKTIFVKRDGDTLVPWEGNRRTLHAREANRRLVKKGLEPVKVKIEIKSASDEQIFALQRLNNRHHLDESPLQTAEAAAIMLEKMSEADVAAFLGFGVPMLHIYLALNDLHPKLKEEIAKGVLSPTAGAKLAGLKRDEQVGAFETMKESGELTVAAAAAVRASVRKNGNGHGKGGKPEVVLAPPRRVLAKLVEQRKDLDVKAPKGFWEGVEFALGRRSARTITGMSAAITQVSTPKRKRAATKTA